MRYVLITPAHNEEKTIEKTIHSVISQTVRPSMWVIVSDGSTDKTDEVIKKYTFDNRWIKFIRITKDPGRSFSAKVKAFNAGYNIAKKADFEIIGNLDADITFGSDYFSYLLSKFEEDPQLGVCGTPFVENGKHYDYRFTNTEHVSGACQMFRRACFEEIGGYVPIELGGVDWVAVTTARMKGWKTRTYKDKICFHHRRMGSSSASAYMLWFRQGRKDYLFGNHPLWEILRAVYQMTKKPYVVGGCLIFLGYFSSQVSGKKIIIQDDLKKFVRKEQFDRIKNIKNTLN